MKTTAVLVQRNLEWKLDFFFGITGYFLIFNPVCEHWLNLKKSGIEIKYKIPDCQNQE